MEAHNGISAHRPRRPASRGSGRSGLSISASIGVRDNNEASWTQVLDMLEFMGDATTIPILLDGDTGYGNFNNMRRLVRKLEQRGIAGVCIEDKLFPKTNSFIGRQPAAGRHRRVLRQDQGRQGRQRDDDFCIVARVEALIAGWGLGEALRRAEAYRRGRRRRDPDPQQAVRARRDPRVHGGVGRTAAPVVIVPTKYYARRPRCSARPASASSSGPTTCMRGAIDRHAADGAAASARRRAC